MALQLHRTYEHRSDSGGRRITLNFCGRCGTALSQDLERFPDILGLCGGTFDDPNWFDLAQGTYRHIFIRSAHWGIVLPAGVDLYEEHAVKLDGSQNQPTVLAHALAIRRADTTQGRISARHAPGFWQ
jgi:hypothetical protein